MSEKSVTQIFAGARFKYRSDTKENWEKENPVLLSGEIGVVTDGTETEKVKWGDGKTPWNKLGWWKGPKGDTGVAGKDGINGKNGTDGVSVIKTEINAKGELIITLSDNTVSNLGVVVGEKGEQGIQGIQGEPGKDAVVEDTYNPESENAQSGKAVAEAIELQNVNFNNNSANAIKSSKKGETIFASDVSPIEHNLAVKVSSDTVADLSTITLTQFGKNILPMGKDNWEHGVGEFTFDAEGVYGKYGSGASDFTMCATKYPSGTYSFSAEFSYKSDGSNSKSRILARCFDKDGNILTDVYSNYNAFYKAFILPLDDVLTFTIPDTVAYWQLGWVSMAEAVGVSSSMKFPQLEYGDTITPYEPCVVHTATANADGTVEGLKSVSPNMLLISDNPEVVISTTYKADTKRYIDNKFIELKAELQALILEV